MNKSLKKKWTKKLRSGEYVQGRGQLVTPCKDYDEFCCLGVLCDVMGIEFEGRHVGLFVAGTGHNSTLPKALLDKTGLSKNDQVALMRFNDLSCWNFNQIADWIDENL